MRKIYFDRRSLIINGQRKLLIAGAVHYPRSTPAMWPKIIQESKCAGLNCIETYVFWEGHEPQEGQYNFSGRFNLCRFLDICHEEGLYVILRIGPYICAEWNFGGLPWWLINKKGMVTRTWNEPFMNEVEHWVKVLMQHVGKYQITQAGPIILAELENEYYLISKRYGSRGKRYLAWMSELGPKVGLEVPIIMCEGAPDGVIVTLHGGGVWTNVESFQKRYPLQPALWIEAYPGNFDIWGKPHFTMPAEMIGYEVLSFFAAGGSGINYYMWHGGTNFARDAMYLQTTSYDFDAPLDEYGLPTTKSEYLRKLHLFLHDNAQVLLHGKRKKEVLVKETASGKDDGVYLYSFRYMGKELAFVINAGKKEQKITASQLTLSFPGQSCTALLKKGKSYNVVYRTWDMPKKRIIRKMLPVNIPLSWQMIVEPLPGKGPDINRQFTSVSLPHNMLLETCDETDFGWYRTVVNSPRDARVKLETRVSDFLSVWVNEDYMGSVSSRLLKEDRNKNKDYDVEINITLKKGKNEILLLATALGLAKGDWTINAPQSEEKKGIIGLPFFDKRKIDNLWEFSAGTWGEYTKLFEPAPASLAKWKKIARRGNLLRWYRAIFSLSEKQFSSETSWALDIGTLFKGTIWINGLNIGRYFQVKSLAGKHHSEYDWKDSGNIVSKKKVGPPQHYYHIPRNWLKAGTNTIIILEERGALPNKTMLVQRS